MKKIIFTLVMIFATFGLFGQLTDKDIARSINNGVRDYKDEKYDEYDYFMKGKKHDKRDCCKKDEKYDDWDCCKKEEKHDKCDCHKKDEKHDDWDCCKKEEKHDKCERPYKY